MTSETDPLLTERQAAEYINASPRSMQTWRRQGHGPRFCRLGSRMIRYRRSDLDAWVSGDANQ